MDSLLMLVLVLLLIGALPMWPYSASWGYYPGGFFGLLLVIAILWAVVGPGRRRLT